MSFEVLEAVAASSGRDAVYSGRGLLRFNGICYFDLQDRRRQRQEVPPNFHPIYTVILQKTAAKHRCLWVLPEHAVLRCSLQTAVVFLKGVNRLVFVIDMQCVLSKVEYDF